jgi:hypothetical protein
MPFGGLLPKRTATLLVKHPLTGTKRQDITSLPVRFWKLPKFSDYVIVYRPDTAPLQVVAVLHGKRDSKKFWKGGPDDSLDNGARVNELPCYYKLEKNPMLFVQIGARPSGTRRHQR